MIQNALPYPPLPLASRVGSLDGAADPLEHYDAIGRFTYSEIVERLPDDWTFAGKRILDFGCGAGRTLRHFAQETSEAEIWGCDIDEPSIHWLQENLCPPFHAFLSEPEPPLRRPDRSFDLIWGISVFTHLTDSWSKWLVELHRLLRPDGLLFLTFMGRGACQVIAGEPWDEGKFGMNILKYGQSWDLGGPMVLHSPWWIEEHWGRAFEIISLHPDGFGCDPSFSHGSVLMRKRAHVVDTVVLERFGEHDMREAAALAHNVRQLHAEAAALRCDVDYLRQRGEYRDELEAHVEDLARRIAVFENSRSWRITRPLRGVRNALRVVRP